jgi:hypothetical protein
MEMSQLLSLYQLPMWYAVWAPVMVLQSPHNRTALFTVMANEEIALS